jgi:uncharacterized protein (DUF302 family)
MDSILFLVIGLAIGSIFTMIILFYSSPKLMLKENESSFNMETTEAMITKKVEELGWKMPKVHDLQETMEKNGFTVLPVKVIEICKPEYASMVLKEDKERIVSSLMPCRIAIYERTDGKVYVSRMNSGLMAKPMHGTIPLAMDYAAKETEIILNSVIKK